MVEKSAQPTYKRQRFLLSFIRQLQDGATATELQKLVFLYAMQENSEFYEFIPYKFGCYSFQLAEDVEILHRDGYISTGGARIRAVEHDTQDTEYHIAAERGNELIRRVYREYPYYAINSEIVGRLFTEEEALHFLYEKKNYFNHNQVLFTIGYEGKSIEAFMNILIKNNVRLLCDVRKNPLSRKFGFSKAKLKHIAETVGIQYVHLPELGIASEQRSTLVTPKDYEYLFNRYQKTLINLKPQLMSVYSLLNSHVRIALMCFEKEPEMCHRHVIRDYLTSTYNIRSQDL